jgi:hypothetical protein
MSSGAGLVNSDVGPTSLARACVGVGLANSAAAPARATATAPPAPNMPAAQADCRAFRILLAARQARSAGTRTPPMIPSAAIQVSKTGGDHNAPKGTARSCVVTKRAARKNPRRGEADERTDAIQQLVGCVNTIPCKRALPNGARVYAPDGSTARLRSSFCTPTCHRDQPSLGAFGVRLGGAGSGRRSPER